MSKYFHRGSDAEKIAALADAFGDEVERRGYSFTIPAWELRFTFNEVGEIVKIQRVVNGRYETLSRCEHE